MSRTARLVGFFAVDGEDFGGAVQGNTVDELMDSIVGRLLARGGEIGDDLIGAGRGGAELTPLVGITSASRAEAWARMYAELAATRYGNERAVTIAGYVDELMNEYDARFPEDDGSGVPVVPDPDDPDEPVNSL